MNVLEAIDLAPHEGVSVCIALAYAVIRQDDDWDTRASLALCAQRENEVFDAFDDSANDDMVLDALVELAPLLHSRLADCPGPRRHLKVLHVHVDVPPLLNLHLLSQLNHDLILFFLRDLVGHIQIIHNEEVLGVILVQVKVVDAVEVRHAGMDDIAIVVALLKDVLARVHKHLRLVENVHLQRDEENIHLLVEDHHDVAELQPCIVIAHEWDCIELVLRSLDVVMHPDLLALRSGQHLFDVVGAHLSLRG